jgi:hypothetical protein
MSKKIMIVYQSMLDQHFYEDTTLAMFSFQNFPSNSTMQKENSHHIKMSAHA